MRGLAPIVPAIEGAGALCAVGAGIAQIHASVRAGISRFAMSSIHDRRFDPIRMALVLDDALEPLAPALEDRGFTPRQRRILQLAAPALRAAMAALPVGEPPPPVFVGLPEPRATQVTPTPAEADLLTAFAAQAGVMIDEKASHVFPRGRAAALLALDAAVKSLLDGQAEFALVGGVDTYLDLALLGDLDVEQRILGETVSDGFIPGEGAAFILLRALSGAKGSVASAPRSGAVVVAGVGTAQDRGHRYGSEPARGEGLSDAIEKLLETLPAPPAQIEITFAGFNGESFGAKEWGVASLRHRGLFAPAASIEHPADCYGDVGAATGALLLALASATLGRGHSPGPALVFASSDREDRGCALLDLLA